MSMSKKDYVAIAAALKEVGAVYAVDHAKHCAQPVAKDSPLYAHGTHAVYDTAQKLCAVFAKDNRRFDKVIFLRACGITTGADR